MHGIRNDQKVVDQLEGVTLLYAHLVNFTEFSAASSPEDVVELLSRVFKKFDQVCEQLDVYKVHAIGEGYVVMGYTGKIDKNRRSAVVQQEEAQKVLLAGFEMCEIIAEERHTATSPHVKKLEMRIGIHTGKIVGGIIGAKVVHYDIFGQDVLIAHQVERQGVGD